MEVFAKGSCSGQLGKGRDECRMEDGECVWMSVRRRMDGIAFTAQYGFERAEEKGYGQQRTRK